MLRDISLHIHDLAENAIAAHASRIDVRLRADGGFLYLELEDDGSGMSAEFLARVTDPFTTGRTTRKVGMGIPFFKMACEQAGGSFAIRSAPGKGTCVSGSFRIEHIDRLPLGNVGETASILILESPQTHLVLRMQSERGCFTMDTDAIRETLEDVPIETPEIRAWILEYVNEGVMNIFGGVLNEIVGGA